MERVEELKSRLRLKRQEYQSLRDDYEIIKQNLKTNLDSKKAMRKEIAELTKEYRALKGDTGKDRIDDGTDSLL